MEIGISGRHFAVSEPLKQYAARKMSKLDHYGLKLESAQVIFDVEKFRHIVELTVLGKDLRLAAKEQSIDMYAAFDRAFGTLQLQLRRRHDRLKDHKGRRFAGSDKTSREIQP